MIKNSKRILFLVLASFVLMVMPALAQPRYAYEFGFVDYGSMDTTGGGTGFKGPFSVSLKQACDRTAPITRIPNRNEFVVVGDFRCDTGEKVRGLLISLPDGSRPKTVFQFRIGIAVGQQARDFIDIEMGIPGLCGVPPTVNVRNRHPSSSIRATIRIQNYRTGAVQDDTLVVRPGQVYRSHYACAFGYSWVTFAEFL